MLWIYLVLLVASLVRCPPPPEGCYFPASPISAPRIRDMCFVAELGEGSFGLVNRVVDPLTGETYAAKAIAYTPGSRREPRTMRSFRNEICILSALDHKHIVKMYGYETMMAGLDENYYHVILFEDIQGIDLFDYIRSGHIGNNPQYENEVNILAYKLAQTLYYLKTKNVLHRDIKPENIRLTADNEPKILDFGLSYRGHIPADITYGGTRSYMSPEAVAVLPLDFKTDVYSLGAVFFELMTGKRYLHVSDNLRSSKLYSLLIHHTPDYKRIRNAFARDLISGMLQPDSEKRMSIENVLCHPYFHPELHGL